MFLQPKNTKYRKIRKGRLKKLAFKSHNLQFGSVGLKVIGSGLISARQLEAARRSITRKLQRKGKLWLRSFPNLPVSKKPNESRMGKGAGSVSFWAARVKSGEIVFEICGVTPNEACEALTSGGHKLPLKTKLTLRKTSS